MLYKQAAEASPRERIRLLDELVRRNPGSAYLPQALGLYMQAYRILGEHQHAPEYAEKILAKDDQNEDAILVAAEEYLERKSPNAVRYAAKLIALMRTKPRPATVREEDWTKKRADYTGAASWIVGATYISTNQFAEAERMFRHALASPNASHNRIAPPPFHPPSPHYNLD